MPLPGTFSLLQIPVIKILLRLCEANPPCTDLVIPITAGASNNVFPIPGNFNYSDPNAVDALIYQIGSNEPYPVQSTRGTFQLSARYCAPQVNIASRAKTIQLLVLVHGVTYNKLYWSGLSYPVGYHGTHTHGLPLHPRKAFPHCRLIASETATPRTHIP